MAVIAFVVLSTAVLEIVYWSLTVLALEDMSTDSTPILSKWVDNRHLTLDRVPTKKNWVNESFVTRRWFPIHQMFYSPIMPRALSLPCAGSLYWRDRKTFLYFMVGSPSGNDIVSDRAVSGESGIRNHNAMTKSGKYCVGKWAKNMF